ncbi:MAG TPA: 4-hydroxy-tetrahydrodipicolinate reductase [Edaphocola sp.]|nr:4-hydroxy-tetrahydrodipicolinate reductase [Edaphocola sp.]
MKIILFGYGKMGKAIEKIAIERHHEILLKIDRSNKDTINLEDFKNADVVIEFTKPEIAFENVSKILNAGLSLVCGTTGWNQNFKEAENIALQNNTSFIHASNFSIGVNLFFEINKLTAKMMQQHSEYTVSVEETHHTQKLDAPSGTAITIAEQILESYTEKNGWSLNPKDNELSITSHRIDNIPGTHNVKYSSNIDEIELIHTAHSRDGFALGAVIAAEYIHNKKGIFTMRDVLFS